MTEQKNPGHELANVISISAQRDWTDEQWAEHDARVAAANPVATVALPRATLDQFGWPARALRDARSADRARPSCARILANDFGRTNVVVLSGPSGCGKTVAAACWALDRGQRTRFVRAATFAAASRYDAEQRSLWYDADALVLDDLGAEYLDAKGSFLVDLDELVDTYYGDLRPLVITTNAQKPAFAARYGERVMDRLRQCATWY